MKYLILALTLSFTCLQAQVHWELTTKTLATEVGDIALDKSGNLYLSIKGNDLIYHRNIFDTNNVYTKLPKVSDQYFKTLDTEVSLLLDFKDSLIALRNFVPFRYFGNFFAYDTIGRVNSNPMGYTSLFNMKYNLKGELFGTYLGERIMKFTDKWRVDQNNLVYDPESILYNYFPFDDENNYAITGGQLLGKGFRIVKFSSTKPESKILFETKSNLDWQKVICTKEGHFFIADGSKLLNVFNEGNTIETILVEPSLETNEIEQIYQTQSGDAVIIKAASGLYASFDLGTTWRKLHSFNQNLPDASNFEYLKMQIIDTSNAVLITSYCGGNKTFLLTSQQVGWQEFNAPADKANVTEMFKAKNNRMYIQVNDCVWFYSDQEAAEWHPVMRDNVQVQGLAQDKKGQLYTYNKDGVDANVLYRWNEASQNWETNDIFADNIAFIKAFHDGSLMLVTKRPDYSNNPYYTFYYSSDFGENWILQSSKNWPNVDIVDMEKAADGAIYLIQSNYRDPKVSKDLGKTWGLESRFNSIMSVKDLNIDDAGNFIFTGTINNVSGIYKSADLNNFEYISSSIPSSILKITTIKPGVIVTATVKSGVQITYDYGNTWTNITSNLDYELKKRDYPTNFIYLDNHGRIFLARSYDGIYRSNSNAVGVTDRPINRLALLSCSPNPTEGILQIQLDKSVLSLRPSIEVYNSTGQSIMKNEINSEVESIDLASFPSGTYFLRVVSSTGTIGLEKILKY